MKKPHKWTLEETDILVKMYPKHTAWEIAYRLGLTIPQIRSKVVSLGITKESKYENKQGNMYQDITQTNQKRK